MSILTLTASLPSVAAIGGRRFSPGGLFTAGEQGTWFDPSDLSTLFQDSAGTIAVTGTGQYVGRMLDKSGRGNHATQSTSSARPMLEQDAGGRYYLSFDGVDDCFTTGTVDFTTTNKISIFAGLRKISDAASYGIIAELSGFWGNPGGFILTAPGTTGGYLFGTTGSFNSSVDIGGYAAPITNVVTGTSDISADSLLLRVNGSQVASSSTDQGTGNFMSSTIQIGRRTFEFPFSGRLYGLVILGRLASASEIANTESWLNVRSGAY